MYGLIHFWELHDKTRDSETLCECIVHTLFSWTLKRQPGLVYHWLFLCISLQTWHAMTWVIPVWQLEIFFSGFYVVHIWRFWPPDFEHRAKWSLVISPLARGFSDASVELFNSCRKNVDTPWTASACAHFVKAQCFVVLFFVSCLMLIPLMISFPHARHLSSRCARMFSICSWKKLSRELFL